jgi:hypothetical protein
LKRKLFCGFNKVAIDKVAIKKVANTLVHAPLDSICSILPG